MPRGAHLPYPRKAQSLFQISSNNTLRQFEPVWTSFFQMIVHIFAMNNQYNKIKEHMEETTPKKKENPFVRFLVSLVWLVISIAVDVIAVVSTQYVIGIVA